MRQKLLFLLIALLWAGVGFAQRDTTLTVLPPEAATDSIEADSIETDTVYIYYTHRRHRTHSFFRTRPTLQEKAKKRRHKEAQKKARERRHERMAAAHKHARSHSAQHRSSHNSSHHSSHRSSSHSRGRR
ncbi:MAG: hypothetical protein II448_04790 [Paludibacteraceae bacterium]|nr:hypothetical protein [Paludibacteraceae bacterium]